jgi:hypothetical protein
MATPVTAVLAVYKEHPTQWVGPCLESLVDPGGVRDIIMVTDQVNPAWVRWANAHQVSMAVIKIDANGDAVRFRQFAETVELRTTARLVAWRAGARLIATGGRFVALDVDTLVRRPLADLFAAATPALFGLAVPRALLLSGRYGYRTAVLAGQVSPLMDRYLEDWVREITRLGVHRTQMKELYGSLESAAWHTLVSRAEESGGIVLSALPVQWCLQASDAAAADVGILHFQQVPPVGHDNPTWQTWALAGKRSGL